MITGLGRSFGLSEEWLCHAAGGVAVYDAVSFLYSGQVQDVVATTRAARGIVVRASVYRASLRLDRRSLRYDCSCRHAEFGCLCRHAIAVALAWMHSSDAPPPGEPPPVKRYGSLGPWVADNPVAVRNRALELMKRRTPATAGSPPTGVDWSDPAGWLVGSFLDEGDGDSAWRAAWDYGATLEQWAHLLRLRVKARPSEVLPVYRLLVDRAVDGRNDWEYMRAVLWMREARRVSQSAGDASWFPKTLAEVRLQHRVRRNFIGMLAEEPWG